MRSPKWNQTYVVGIAADYCLRTLRACVHRIALAITATRVACAAVGSSIVAALILLVDRSLSGWGWGRWRGPRGGRYGRHKASAEQHGNGDGEFHGYCCGWIDFSESISNKCEVLSESCKKMSKRY